MASPSSSKLRTFVGIGFVLALMFLWVFWPSTPEAAPGKQPAAPPRPGEQSALKVGQPTDGMVAPPLSASDLATLKSGKSVSIEVPGGKLEISPHGPGNKGKK
jgi:hypothetical protein